MFIHEQFINLHDSWNLVHKLVLCEFVLIENKIVVVFANQMNIDKTQTRFDFQSKYYIYHFEQRQV